jgi:outer membrane lipoprotein-sorting protein
MIHIALFLALTAQDKTNDAAELLKKVEEKAVSAKSLRWKGTAKIGADGKEFSLALDATFMEGNRARLDAESKDEKVPITFRFTCDGKRINFESSKLGDQIADADKGFAAGLNRILVRGGIFTINHLKPDSTGEKLVESVKVSDLSLADEKLGDRAARVLSYTLEVDGKSTSVKLWVDAKTLAPIKREVISKQEPVIHETYDEWTVDAEIKDDLFKVGEGKKDK